MHGDAHDDHPHDDRSVTERAGEVAEQVVEPAAEWRWTGGDTGRVVIAGLIVFIGGLAASRGVPSWERAAFLKVNGQPDAFYPFLWPPMQLGNIWVGTAVAGTAALLMIRPHPGAAPRRRRLRAAALLLAAPVVAWFVAKGVKAVVGRGRPAAVGLDVIQRGEAETGLGYLSGHATVAFALAGALAAHLRRPWRGVLLAVATLVAAARVYVGVHLPLDVIGGAACGLLIGEAARVIELTSRSRAGFGPQRFKTGTRSAEDPIRPS